MKKVMIALMMVVTTSTACFANASNDDVQKAAKEAYRSNCRIFETYFFSIGQIAG